MALCLEDDQDQLDKAVWKGNSTDVCLLKRSLRSYIWKTMKLRPQIVCEFGNLIIYQKYKRLDYSQWQVTYN